MSLPCCSKARIAGCSTPEKPFRVCAPPRNTRCGSAADTIIAWACSTAFSSRKTTSWRRVPSAPRSPRHWRARSAPAGKSGWKSRWKTWNNCARPSTRAPTSPCSTISRWPPCARRWQSTPRRTDRSSWRHPAALPRRPSAASPAPGSISSPSAPSPNMCAPSTCPCASNFKPDAGAAAKVPCRAGRRSRRAPGGFSGAVGGLQHALRLRHAVSLRVVHAQALQHVDDLLILGELGDGLFAGQVPDLVDRAHHLPVDGIVQYLLDEAAVDLQVVDRKVLQVAERRQAGAEIVEREFAAQFLQGLNEAIRLREARDGRRLGDFEADFGGVQAAAMELIDDIGQKFIVAQALAREIDRAHG